MHDVVISSRVRLARNLAGMPFLSKCSEQQQRELEARLRKQILEAHIAQEVFYVDLSAAGELDRRLLMERQLISRQQVEASHPRGVAVAADEKLAIMVNEEDHLRIAVLRSAMQLDDAVADTNRIDDLLEERLNFAFSSQYGYLTACPTNVGTGLRVSVMLHLPALKISNQIEKVFRAAGDLHLAIRGLYGEGTEAIGEFYQISNQVTLGKSEQQIIDEFRGQIIPHFIEYERRAREALMHHRRTELEDKVHRAVAILQSARMIGSQETMYMLSLTRLGIHLGIIDKPDIATVNELFLLTQPAHLQRILNRELTGNERAEARAAFIRERLR